MPPGEKIANVLVVEDVGSLRDHIAETIEEFGQDLKVAPAADGQEALDLVAARSEPFKVIVTDITMPRLDGEALLRRLGKVGCPSPVIMLTAHGQDDIIIRCLNAGACDYLVKPVCIDDLMLSVNTTLKHGGFANLPVEAAYDPNGWFEISGGSDYSVLYRYRKFLGLLSGFRLQD